MIGAGISGITAGVLLPAKVPGIDLTIYEKNSDVVRFCHPSVLSLDRKISNHCIGRNMAREYM